MNVQPEYLSRADAAEYLHQKFGMSVSRRRLDSLATENAGPPYLMAGKQAIYPVPDLDAWARARITAPPERRPLSPAAAERRRESNRQRMDAGRRIAGKPTSADRKAAAAAKRAEAERLGVSERTLDRYRARAAAAQGTS